VRVATDIGGTFTDLVYVDEDTGEFFLGKESSTPPDFERGVMNSLAGAGIGEGSGVWSFAHGSTVVINAITERRGGLTALITTRGFRDVLELSRSNRPDLYNLRYEKPRPFVDRYLRFEVRERVSHEGDLLVTLDRDGVARAVERALSHDVTAIAICFMHAYANPENEVRCAELVRELAPDVFVTMSHEITMEWREYERTSSAVLNGYVQKTAATYIERLRSGLATRGITERLFVMQSSGGTMPFDEAKRTPINLVESGPVGGVIGAAVIGKLIGRPNVISLDIGGTTAKTSLIENGDVKITTDYRIERSPTFPGYPIKVPVVDIVEIGAGGGSIAWIDEAGGLNVGPQSAGAVPGPACYPNGGAQPTVTDANLIAGRIDPDYFLGGRIEVSVERARLAMARIASPLNLAVEEAAIGVIRLANAKMMNAIKLVSVRRGYDPRDFDMVAFGGGGSMHAAAIATDLKIARVIVPPAPAHFSAWGMLMTDLRADWVRTRVTPLEADTVAEINEIYAGLEETARAHFRGQGLSEDRLRVSYLGDMRYKGQEHTVRVALGGPIEPGGLAAVIERFHEMHQHAYTFRLDAPVEFVNFHLTAFGAVEKPKVVSLPLAQDGLARALKGERDVDFDTHGRHPTSIYERALLGAGLTITGPAVVEDPAASTIVFPGQTLRVDEWGNLLIDIGSAVSGTEEGRLKQHA
jgi:N-methylhydantoinase A